MPKLEKKLFIHKLHSSYIPMNNNFFRRIGFYLQGAAFYNNLIFCASNNNTIQMIGNDSPVIFDYQVSVS